MAGGRARALHGGSGGAETRHELRHRSRAGQQHGGHRTPAGERRRRRPARPAGAHPRRSGVPAEAAAAHRDPVRFQLVLAGVVLAGVVVAGSVVAGIVVGGVVVAGVVVAGVVVAGVVVAGVVVAGVVVAGVVVAGVVVAGVVVARLGDI